MIYVRECGHSDDTSGRWYDAKRCRYCPASRFYDALERAYVALGSAIFGQVTL